MWRIVFAAITLIAVSVTSSLGQERIPIKIGWQPVLYPGLFVAWEKGYFEKNGLNPKFVKFLAGPPILSSFQTGDVDVAVMGIPPLIHGVAQGIDLQTFLVDDEASAGVALVARKGSGIHGPKDLKGKKIAYVFGSTVHPGLLEVLRQNGMSEKDINLINMQVPAILPAFERGDVDAVYLWQPWTIKAQALGGTRVFSDRDVGVYSAGLWAARRDYLEQQRDTVDRFIRSYAEGIAYALTHPEETIKIGARLTGTPPELMGVHFGELDFLTIERQLSGSPISLGRSNALADSPMVKVLDRYISFFFEKKVISSRPDAMKMVNPGAVERYLGKR